MSGEVAETVYPAVEDIIETNWRVLQEIKVKRADRHRVLSRRKVEDAIRKTTESKGDVYDKASTLLMELVQGHAFASGVRRTAFTVAISFLKMNGANANVVNNPDVLTGIRERFYSKDEVKNWLKGNEVRKFTRS
jgi:prophage maintenance system killer protein